MKKEVILMGNEYVGKYIRLTQTHIDILDNIIQAKPGINNYADAVRYAILSMENNTDDNALQKKINSMSKNIDLLIELTAGGFHEQGVRAITDAYETFIYMDAKKNVENKIQRSTTIKSNIKKSNVSGDKEVAKKKHFL